jgi:hypothetical protein
LIVKFRDEQIQQRFDSIISLPVDGLMDEQRPVFGLMYVYDWFRRSHGERSPQVQEIIGHLLSEELRPALRSWYSFHGNRMNPAATDFREYLSELSGEKFG